MLQTVNHAHNDKVVYISKEMAIGRAYCCMNVCYFLFLVAAVWIVISVVKATAVVLSPQHLLRKLPRHITSRIKYPMDMHHALKRFVDYAPWVDMYFTVAGDAHYF
ncbi:hypothetical protein SDC9_12460 [bioreactor metagenome]|uniref:Uncharacterized protein n=1 Tax=bioreactor metagenome TaxID=1076179 RepID=A0A644TKF2_9ZZZZ